MALQVEGGLVFKMLKATERSGKMSIQKKVSSTTSLLPKRR